MAKEYINKDHPVYFSYAWANNEHPEIEKDVEALCKLLEENNIYYKRDKSEGENSLCPYRWSIRRAEEEIGEGTAIIVVISKRYIESLHCMHEWHLIRESGKIKKRVFPVVLEDADISKKEVYREYYNFFNRRKTELNEQLQEDIISLTEVESRAVKFSCFINDLKEMYQYIADYNVLKVSLLRQNDYKTIIKQLTDHLKDISRSDKDYSNRPLLGSHLTFNVPDDGLIIEIRKGPRKVNVDFCN
ncbi:MAG: toll/interleukin-1 receptor domain-containing protein [Bacteroidales bacterium]|nr:toll/interleukin-1 receptor domain-containing protein [Bacteroidales bacterium]